MNIKMAINSKLSTNESKKQTKQTSRTETESQLWRSFGGLSVGKGKGENRGKGAGIKSTNWQVQNRQGDVKNNVGNGVAKELICMTHGHELRGGIAGGNVGHQVEEGKRGKLGQL